MKDSILSESKVLIVISVVWHVSAYKRGWMYLDLSSQPQSYPTSKLLTTKLLTPKTHVSCGIFTLHKGSRLCRKPSEGLCTRQLDIAAFECAMEYHY